jgi:hypothetical protein
MEKIRPLLIVMTPVRNEAWVLHAFLKTTSTWADFIIIADQMSTDGSRDIYKQYDKVVLIDNNNPDFNEAERQSMLVTKAREIANHRDCILFGLDADEIFSANYTNTNDWKEILMSNPGAVFWFKWAELSPNKKNFGDSVYYPWMFHDDGKEPHSNYVRNMHSMRIPYPIQNQQLHYVNDFRILHLAYLNMSRVASKCRFYTYVDYQMNHRSVISLSRNYRYQKKLEEYPIDEKYLNYGKQINVLNEVDTTSKKFWFDEYILERCLSDLNKIALLDIWDKEFIETYHLKDPRNIFIKLLHFYLKKTQKDKSTFAVRAIDKVLKFFV